MERMKKKAAHRLLLGIADHGSVDKAWAGHVHFDVRVDELQQHALLNPLTMPTA